MTTLTKTKTAAPLTATLPEALARDVLARLMENFCMRWDTGTHPLPDGHDQVEALGVFARAIADLCARRWPAVPWRSTGIAAVIGSANRPGARG